MNPNTPSELIANGYPARRDREPDEARSCFSQALRLCSASDDKLHSAQAHAGLGQIERDRNNIGAALKHYQIAVELLRKQEEPLVLAHTIRHVADILLDEGNLESTQRHYEEALAIYCAHETTPPLDLANALRGFAQLMEKSNKIEEATMLWRQAHALYDQLEIEAGVTESQAHLAFLMGRQSQGQPQVVPRIRRSRHSGFAESLLPFHRTLNPDLCSLLPLPVTIKSI